MEDLAARRRGGTGEPHSGAECGLGFGILRATDEGLFFLAPVFETARGGDFVTGFGEYVRGTRGATSAVSNRQDGLVFGKLGKALFEVAEGDVDVAFEGA